ncbi:hypothetical protein J2Z35_002533 [Acetoanaerobium pronyense]|uniref:GIY-YIG domain-containing protein n=1 Tax=Acetoanaerobium pronyense TaxID=1482736 RepID=A0ABS4KLQ3_9FIRM|nr:hypothetical protein [Acetoanaerobium pronyense]MBP2028703.1 hypothetical protein [Acetoanaerobium pronyense]
MGIWDKLGKVAAVVVDKAPEVLGKMAVEGAKMQRNALEKQGKQIRDYEEKIKKVEANSHKLSLEQKMKLQEKKKELESYNQKVNSVGASVKNGEVLYDGKSINEWKAKWQGIGYLKSANLTPYNKCVGLYRHRVNGNIVYVGRAIELNNGGFRKRLSDYRRESDSARKHESGKTINDHLDEIVTDILIVGETEEAIKTTKLLENAFIGEYNPIWNKQNKKRY